MIKPKIITEKYLILDFQPEYLDESSSCKEDDLSSDMLDYEIPDELKVIFNFYLILKNSLLTFIWYVHLVYDSH